MKIGNRILSVLLCLVMSLSMFSTIVFAEVAVGEPLPTGDASSLTGAKPTTDVALTINANAFVVDGTVTDQTTDYVLEWNGTSYPNMFTYGVNLFSSLKDVQQFVKSGDTVLVKSLPKTEDGTAFVFTAAANYYTENYNTLPYVVGTAFDGSDWTANEAYNTKAVTLGNVSFELVDSDAEDGVESAGKIALYGFSFKFSGAYDAFNLNNMPDVFADFIVQNSAVSVKGGSPVFSMNSYASGKANSKGSSVLLKNFHMTGECTRLFTEYVVDYFTIDGWNVPANAVDSTYQMYLKISGQGGKSKLLIKNSNFQDWNGWIYFQMANTSNWFVSSSDKDIPGASADIDFRPVYVENNIFNNSSLFNRSVFHQTYANATSKTVFTGNRIINTGEVVPFIKNNSDKWGNYFSLVMQNNYIKGYSSVTDFSSDFMEGYSSSVHAPFGDIRNNYISDNTEANAGTTFTVSKLGDPSKKITSTDWYIDAEMTLLNSEVAPLQIKSVSASNGDAHLFNLSAAHAIVYNLKSGNASALTLNFETAGAQYKWYSDITCTKELDPSTIKSGDNKTAYIKVNVPGKKAALIYTVYVFKSENLFADVFTSEHELLTKDMLLVSNMNGAEISKYSIGQPFEYKLPTDGKTYTFIKGINAFDDLGSALSFAKQSKIETASVYFDYSNADEVINVTHSAKIIAPNFNVKPFDDKGFSESDKINDGTGDNAWTYNADYDANKRTVGGFAFSGYISPVTEVYGVEVKPKAGTSRSFAFDKRAADDNATSIVLQNILITEAVTMILQFSNKACIEDDSALVKNFYVRSGSANGQLSLNSNYMPETMVFDGLFMDFNALGTDNRNSTRWWFKQGNSDNSFVIRNSNLRNFYNETNPMFNFMGNADYPAENAGGCTITFEHNILANFAAGNFKTENAFIFFSGKGTDYSRVSFTNNYISAPAGISANIAGADNTEASTIPLILNMQGNVIKGLKDFGVKRTLAASSTIKENYRTEVSSSDNTVSGTQIILNGNKSSIVSKNHYVDYNKTLLSTSVEVTDVQFGAGALVTDTAKNKFIGIANESVNATIADFSYKVPEGSEATWYEDSELTLPIAEEDLYKITAAYAPAYLKVNSPATPEFYILYTFEIKVEYTPENLFTETFEDPEGLIDPSKALVTSMMFDGYADGTYVESDFNDETIYSFVKGENAFNTVTDAIAYAKENGIENPHILVLDHTAFGKVSASAFDLNVSTTYVPCSFFTRNYAINPVIKGEAVDGSDWSGNIGTEYGQFDPDKSVALKNITFMTTVEAGDYKFYGFTISGVIEDKTTRNKALNIEFINTYYNRNAWGTVALFQFATVKTATAAVKANRDSFVMRNTYFECNKAVEGSKLFSGTIPSTVILDTFYTDIANASTKGLNAYEFNCYASDRTFEFRNCCFVDLFFKGTGTAADSKIMKNSMTGNKLANGEVSKFIVDGCTFVNSNFAAKALFSLDLNGLTELQITNNKVYNDSLTMSLLVSFNAKNDSTTPLKTVVTGNSFNKITLNSTVKRTLTDDSIIADNYAVATFDKAAPATTYGGKEMKFVNGSKTVLDCTSYFVDSALECYATSGIRATFDSEKTEEYEDGYKYIIGENDSVIADNNDGTFDIDISDIVTNPAGNKVEFECNGEKASLGDVITVALDDTTYVEINVIGHALSGDDTATTKLILTSKPAKITSIEVGGAEAMDMGDGTFYVALSKDGADEEIIVSTYAESEVEIYDEYGDPVTNVYVESGYGAEYEIVVSTEVDSKTYYLYVERETEDRDLLASQIEELLEEVKTALNEESDAWLSGAKEYLVYARSAALEALDEMYSADILAQAYEELAAALENARNSIGLDVLLEEKIAELKEITNEDGIYCEPVYEEFIMAVEFVEAIAGELVYVEGILELIEQLDQLPTYLVGHTFTEYVHDAGTENCNSNGTMTAKCDNDGCSATDTVAETEDYKNDKHDYKNYKYNGDAEVNKDGTETGTCSRCGDKDTRTAVGTMLGFVDSANKFKDVATDKWFKKFVDYVVTYDLMNGKAADIFDPNAIITRAEFVQVLANMSGVDTSNKKNDTKFTDLKDGAWYVPAVRWAVNNGIVSGVSSTSFAPNAAITREQMCVMLAEYADFANITLEKVSNKINFKDANKISSWAKEEVEACQMAGIVEGDGINFRPKDTATRAEIAVIIKIFHENYLAKA